MRCLFALACTFLGPSRIVWIAISSGIERRFDRSDVSTRVLSGDEVCAYPRHPGVSTVCSRPIGSELVVHHDFVAVRSGSGTKAILAADILCNLRVGRDGVSRVGSNVLHRPLVNRDLALTVLRSIGGEALN